MRRSWLDVMNSFSNLLKHYDYLKAEHSAALRAKENVATIKHLEQYPVLTAPPHNFTLYLEQLTECLDAIIFDYEEYEQTQLMYYVLDDFDYYFINPGRDNKLITGVVGDARDVFLKPSKYWKAYKGSPIDSSKSFSSFGLYDVRSKAAIIRLDDLADQFHIENNTVDPIEKSKQLNVGLFPLSKEFLRTFRITGMTNEIRKIYGFLSDKLLHEAYAQEVEHIIKSINDNDMHIAVFPELLINDEVVALLKEGVKSLNKQFFILVAGSDHRKYADDKYKNTVPVLVYFNQQIHEFSYSKMDSFHLEVNEKSFKDISRIMPGFHDAFGTEAPWPVAFLKEDVDPDHTLLLLSTKKFGDIGFVICKDALSDFSFLIENYQRLADHMFIISLNFSPKADFLAKSNHMVMESHIGCYYVNARSFDTKNVSPTFYVTPKDPEPVFIKDEQTHLPYTIYPRLLPQENKI